MLSLSKHHIDFKRYMLRQAQHDRWKKFFEHIKKEGYKIEIDGKSENIKAVQYLEDKDEIVLLLSPNLAIWTNWPTLNRGLLLEPGQYLVTNDQPNQSPFAIEEGIVLDYDESGKVVGIDIDDTSQVEDIDSKLQELIKGYL